MIEKLFTCHVCGYSKLTECPWTKDLNPSWDICPSCGTHFGNDDFGTTHDEIFTRHLVLRKKWIENGMKWWSNSSKPPENWNPEEQLKNIGVEI